MFADRTGQERYSSWHQSACSLTGLVRKDAVSTAKMHVPVPDWSGEMQFSMSKCMFADRTGQERYSSWHQTACSLTGLVRRDAEFAGGSGVGDGGSGAEVV
ncbi:hypothetical protein BIFGAL_04035 [Bifidobacterium gallicum DSM 20093 = LMG 11596]|uniref:Uncharacterized protein n=1 Tax=Bifidobacterium gallicum DSM 20093 = LMG 11596 TaxID=561180 RepID=D1NVZ2_9BIFI|nr:hypothetical protein BIFGAL_04035 [Bifidobacterium gallicum DSM 20093 = LMG 11596]